MWNEFKVANSFTLETSMFGQREKGARDDYLAQKQIPKKGNVK